MPSTNTATVAEFSRSNVNHTPV